MLPRQQAAGLGVPARTRAESASTLQTSQETQPAGLILSAAQAEGRRVQRGAGSPMAGRGPHTLSLHVSPHRGGVSAAPTVSGGYPGGLGGGAGREADSPNFLLQQVPTRLQLTASFECTGTQSFQSW